MISREGKGGGLRGESGFVDAVVYVVVGPVICSFDFCLEVLGEEVYFLVFVGKYVVEFCIEHADDLTGLCMGRMYQF